MKIYKPVERQIHVRLNWKNDRSNRSRETLIGYLLQAAKGMDAVEGCYMYVVSSANDDPNGIWITEVWRDKAAHDASLQLEGAQELIAKARPIIAGFGERFESTPIGGKGLPDNV